MNHRETRGRITAGEVSLVCSRYDLGVIEEVRYFRGGSRSSPKVLLITPPSADKTERSPGRRAAYLLKKRPAGTDPYRVAHSHEVLLYLAKRGFPVPRLIGTRENHNSMVQLDGNIYELFRFIPGLSYDRSEPAARSSGYALAAFHRAMADFHATWTPAAGNHSYHGVTFAKERVAAAGKALGGRRARQLTDELGERYERAAGQSGEAVGAKGSKVHEQFIHGDWHPGNLVFIPSTRPGAMRLPGSENVLVPPASVAGGGGGGGSGGVGASPPASLAVGAVLDFDTVRLGQPIHDLANGALQFSMNRLGPDPEQWPENLNEGCFHSFVRGYHEYGLQDAAGPGRGRRTSEVLPWLMIEALIVEAAAPIAATGKFGKADPLSILGAVARTTAWIETHASRLGESAAATARA